MKYYIPFISFKFGIKKIIYDESFFSTYNINDNDITNLEALVNYYKNDSFNLDIEEIIIEKENIYSLYQRIYLKYHFKRIFSKKAMCDVIIITFEELKSIIQLKEKEINNLKYKLNHFEYDKNNFKILIIDFKDNSPYQQNFIYFCHNFIGYNESFNKIALFNMGKKNFDINCYNKMKDREPQEPEIYFANLEILMIEVIKDDIMKFIYKNEIMEFIELFFIKIG